GETLQLGPVELEAQAAADHAQALVAHPAGTVDVDPHVHELLDGARGEAVTADLLPGEAGLLQHQHVEPGACEVEGGRGTGGTGADDDDVGVSLAGCVHGHGAGPVPANGLVVAVVPL